MENEVIEVKKEKAPKANYKKKLAEVNAKLVEANATIAKQQQYIDNIFAESQKSTSKLNVVTNALNECYTTLGILGDAYSLLANKLNAIKQYLEGGKNNG